MFDWLDEMRGCDSKRSGTTARAKNEAAELDSSLAFLFVSTDYQDEGDLAKIWREF